MDLDELFGDGAELGDDYVVKAQLRFRVHPPQHPVAQDIVDRIVTAYDERLDEICGEVDDVLRHADLRRSERNQPLVLAIDRPLALLAKGAVYAPGAHGGKWYRDGAGHIRYGEKPMGQFKQRANSEHTVGHIGHLRPQPFMGMRGVDRDLTGFLMHRGAGYGFTKNELRFLGTWYGTDTKPGALFDAFLDCVGLTRDDLRDDLTQLRFGPQQLTYEEAVFEFFAAQKALFVGDEPEGGEEGDDWESKLNDEIRPLLDAVFSKYEALKTDDAFKDSYAGEADRQRRRFFDSAIRQEKATKDLANHVISEWDPRRQVTEVLDGLRNLGLIARPSHVVAHAHVHDRPHLKTSVALDDRLLTDDPSSNPLIASKDKLSGLSASNLMLLYAAAELHRRWDPETRSYSTEEQADVGPGALGEVVLGAIAGKSKKWRDAVSLVQEHLDVLVDRLVEALNRENAEQPAAAPKRRRRPTTKRTRR